MRNRVRRYATVILWILLSALAVPAHAQEATVSGSVTDSTGGALPGVTITATHDATGTTVTATTDERGFFRIPLRVGPHTLTAELDGFATITQNGLVVLVGQQLNVTLQMRPAALQETITVTGDAPLINVSQSDLSSNIDPRQLSELPVNGRNWIELTMLASGNRMNNVAEVPGGGNAAGAFQLNIDGQQVTQLSVATFGQPRYSQDAIAEFEFIANRFDATQGRSAGVQVNAITKSGTNMFAGSMSSYFRHDRLNAADFVAKRVLPYSDQQLSTTFGGPIVANRFHFFANYEYERQPVTFTYNSPYPSFNFDQSAPTIQNKAGTRLDLQISPKAHLAVRGSKYQNSIPYDPRSAGGANRHPSSAYATVRHGTDAQATLTQVMGTRAANEVRVGWASFFWTQDSVVKWPNGPNAYQGIVTGSPIVNLQGYTFGGSTFNPQYIGQDVYSFRDDLSYSFSAAGRHALKVGAENLYNKTFENFAINATGRYDATGGAVPANLEALFPVWNDVSTWNLNALNPIMRSYLLGIGAFRSSTDRQVFASWVQDDWTITPKLTLNLGLRYDFATRMFAQERTLQPFLQAGRPNEKNDFGPRLGFAYSLTDKTVVRGGFGKYFSDVQTTAAIYTDIYGHSMTVQVQNDGRSDFASNPFNGPIPTFDQAVARGSRRAIASGQIASPTSRVPYSYQGSIGVQRQLGTTMSMQVDYSRTNDRQQLVPRNINLTYNPATGANYPFTDVAHLIYPGWDQVNMNLTDGKTDYQALLTAFTKRFSNRWQASATYTLAKEMGFQPTPLNPNCDYPMTWAGTSPVCNVPITLAPDLAEEWYRTGQQKHRAVFNGIWEAGYGFQLSGLYFFADNGRDQAQAGVDARNTGVTTGRWRANGTLIPRFSIDRANLHRVDLRLSRAFHLSSRAEITGLLDVFNVFNHANYGTYVINERSATFGQPTSDTGNAYQPRIAQIGVRATF